MKCGFKKYTIQEDKKRNKSFKEEERISIIC